MIKLLGFILVTVGCTVFGFSRAGEMTKRCRELRDMEQGFRRMEQEICRLMRPLPEALRLSGIGISGEVFPKVAERIEWGETPSLSWASALEDVGKDTHWEVEDTETLLRFGENLDAEDTEGQMKNFTMIQSLLGERIRMAEAECAREGKIYRSGGLLVGLMIGIILL